MLNERWTNNNSRCQHVQQVHCSSYSVMLIASSLILFTYKLTPAKLDVPDTDSLRSYWPSLWRLWNKFVTTWSTVHYTRYTRIIHCRPCCNVHIVPDLDILNWTTASKTTDQKLLCVLTLWIHLQINWINFGKTRKLFIVAGSQSQVSSILD